MLATVHGVNVTSKEVDVWFLRSEAVIVIVEVPVAPVAGVTVAVQLGIVPENVMFAFGTRVVFVDDPLIAVVQDSTSLLSVNVKAAAIAIGASVVWLEIALNTGAEFVVPLD
jgi:hypothetical protein